MDSLGWEEEEATLYPCGEDVKAGGKRMEEAQRLTSHEHVDTVMQRLWRGRSDAT